MTPWSRVADEPYCAATDNNRCKAGIDHAGSNGSNGSDSAPPEEHTESPFTQKEIVMESANADVDRRAPWNKGKLTGQKPPL